MQNPVAGATYALAYLEPQPTAQCPECSAPLPEVGILGIRLSDQTPVCDTCLIRGAFHLGRLLILDQLTREIGGKLAKLDNDSLLADVTLNANRQFCNLLAAYARAHAVACGPSRLEGLASGLFRIVAEIA